MAATQTCPPCGTKKVPRPGTSTKMCHHSDMWRDPLEAPCESPDDAQGSVANGTLAALSCRGAYPDHPSNMTRQPVNTEQTRLRQRNFPLRFISK